MLLLETIVHHLYLKTDASDIRANACEKFMWYKKIHPNVPKKHIKGGKPIRNI